MFFQQSKDVSVIVVAVGEKVFQEKTTMSKIAGSPKGELLLYPNFDDLPGHLDDIVKATCGKLSLLFVLSFSELRIVVSAPEESIPK